MSEKNKSSLRRIALLLLVLITASFCFCVTANACEVSAGDKPADSCTDMSHWDAYAKKYLNNPIKYGIYSICKNSYIGLSKTLEYVKPLFNLDLPEEVQNLVSAVGGVVKTVGMLLCFVYFLLDLMEHATRDTFSAEAFVKSFAKLMIMFVIFEPANLKILTDFGSSLNKMIADAITDGTKISGFTELGAFIDTLKSTGWLKCIGFLFTIDNSGPGLIMLLVLIVVLLVGVGRLIELTVYRSMISLGMASIYNGGVNSSGFRYLKKCIALEIQGAIMFLTLVAACYISENLSDFLKVSGIDMCLQIAFGLAAMAVIVKSKNIANDIVGV